MGFFTRLLGLRQKNEEGGGEGEGERSIRINFQHHNHGEKWPRLFVLGISIYRAVKGFLQKVGSIFYQPKPAHPLLPLQNPATTQPLLLPTPTISSPTSASDDDDDRALWFQEESYPAETNHHVACASTNDEMARAAFFVEETTMANHHLLHHLKFDRIVYNFPYAGLQAVKNLPRQTQLEHHRRLVRQFMENAREMISEEGEIHITHKTNGFHAEWRVVSLACGRGLRLIEAVKFNRHDYPGYNTKCGFGGNKHFHCYPSKTYKFGLN